MQLKTLHIGGIVLGKETVYTIPKCKLHDVMYELNGWIFDYCYANKMLIKQLPPLDDWTRSTEDPSLWSIAFPDPEWKVYIKMETVEF